LTAFAAKINSYGAAVYALVTITGERGWGGEHGLALQLDLCLVTRRVKDLVADSHGSAVRARAAVLARQIYPAETVRDSDGDDN
jgi:hypothetical protein